MQDNNFLSTTRHQIPELHSLPAECTAQCQRLSELFQVAVPEGHGIVKTCIFDLEGRKR